MTKREFEELLADFRSEMYSVGYDNGHADGTGAEFYSADTSKADELEAKIRDAFTEANALNRVNDVFGL